MLKLQDKVARVSCGTDFTACITVKGHVYSWGTNKWGNLGVENMHYTTEQYVVRQPTLIEGLLGKFIIQISCGGKHMLALSHERRVYSWGSGDYGVLGLGDEIGHNTPQLIKELANEEMICIITGDFNSGAINTNGHLYLWGNGKFGRLGLGSEENYNLPKKVEDAILKEKVFFCSIGFYHTIITTSRKSIHFS
jgi:alpha-tubulin suppressor-like RCC1 family protein